ncbi:tnf receptor-associated factor [Anaeramoeba flamelloides]|uniref:Tnf receptor-associated factor n=1 Tax=Anaeramoeba flamelloides TaxID=1746091 RepID=A0AAV7ZUT9_9EUKA|nr:tnf receptor-associated factor [Anaeramoeba flamelloides]
MTQNTAKKSKRWRIFKKKDKKIANFDQLINRLDQKKQPQEGITKNELKQSDPNTNSKNPNDNTQNRNSTTNNSNTTSVDKNNPNKPELNQLKNNFPKETQNKTQEEINKAQGVENEIIKEKNEEQIPQKQQEKKNKNNHETEHKNAKENYSGFTPKINQKFQYVDNNISESLICGYCNSPFTLPRDLPCKHTFCKNCIYNYLKGSNEGKCYLCKKAFKMSDLVQTQYIVQNLTDNLIVYCSNMKDGCMEAIPRFKLQDHLIKCLYTKKTCKFKGCGASVFLKHFEDHLSTCEYRTIICPNDGCGEELIAKQLQQHLKDCEYRFLECKYCKKIVIFNKMESHLKNECTKSVDKCPHSDFGCKFVGVKEALIEHKKNCVYEKISGLVEINRQITQIAKKQQQQIQLLQEKYDKIVSMVDLEHLKKLKEKKLQQIPNNMPKIKCKNCNQKFSLNNNLSTSCQYHPGKWNLRGLEAWTCCGSSVESSDGCMNGFHIGLTTDN